MVLENAVSYAGPFVGFMFGDLGAEVIVVSSKKVMVDADRSSQGIFDNPNAPWKMLHRNKKDISLNLRNPKGVEIFKELVVKSDIVTDNFRPGTMNRLGLGYEDLKKVKSDIICCHITGFGYTGPQSNRNAYSPIPEAKSGTVWTNYEIDFVEGFPPKRIGTSLADYVTGLNATIACMAALHYRNRTGKGQEIDISMGDCMLPTQDRLSHYLDRKDLSTGIANRGPTLRTAYYASPVRCKNGWISLGLGSKRIWPRFAKLAGREDITYEIHQKDLDLTNRIIDEWAIGLTCEEAVDLIQGIGAPAAVVKTIPQVYEDKQFRARGMFYKEYDPIHGTMVERIGSPLQHMSETPAKHRFRYPRLGEHTEEILTFLLDYTKEEIETLEKEEVLE
jgi:crotonobetainyl-CoA:carnitine CoA-transferase CaiB-like acyl-CoA transferase